MSTIAFVFPGQGSQVVGMAKDVAAMYPVAKDVIDHADSLLSSLLSPIMFDGPAEQLDQTQNTQPALFISSIAMLRVIQQEMPSLAPVVMAGHSLGEFTALVAAGAISFEDGLRLVSERGRLMAEAGDRQPGAMAALLGADVPTVRDLCQQVTEELNKVVVLANDNCPGQTVISGEDAAIDRAIELATEKGVKRAVKLAVSVAAHSPLMGSAADEFRALLDTIEFQTPQVPVIGNVSATPLQSVDDIRMELNQQLTQSVRWTESVQAMISDGADTFVEIGSGDVLTGMLKRIDRSAARFAVNSVDALDGLKTALSS